MADPDDTCPGDWIEIDVGVGYCSLGDECRNQIREAHQRRVEEWAVINLDEDH